MKTFLGRLVITMMMMALAAAPAAAAPSPLGPAHYSAILVDADTSEVLFSNSANSISHPASITKVMTLFLAFDALDAGRLRLDDPVVVTPHAAAQKPSKLGLPPGRTISVEDAIRVIAVKSANDIAVALAERIEGSEARFAQAMTRKARALGMKQTMFSNATGLPDPATFTSAQDIARLSVAMLRTHPDQYRYFSARSFTFGAQTMANHNHLLGVVPGVDGIKTGYTNDAGFTLAASARRGDKRLVAVIMGQPSSAVRDRNVAALLEAGFTALSRRAQGIDADVASLLPTALSRTMSSTLPARIAARIRQEESEGAAVE